MGADSRLTVRIRSRLAPTTRKVLLELVDGEPHQYRKVIAEAAKTINPAQAQRAAETRRRVASGGTAPAQRVRAVDDAVLVRQGSEYIAKRAIDGIQGVIRWKDEHNLEWVRDSRFDWPVVDEQGLHLSVWCACSDPHHPQCPWRFCQCSCHPALVFAVDQTGEGAFEIGPPPAERCPNDKTPLQHAPQRVFVGFGGGKHLWACSLVCAVAELRVELAGIHDADQDHTSPPGPSIDAN